MKLQKQLSRRAEGKDYSKWVIVIPPSKVKELGWKEGEELSERIAGNRLVLMPILERLNSSKGST